MFATLHSRSIQTAQSILRLSKGSNRPLISKFCQHNPSLYLHPKNFSNESFINGTSSSYVEQMYVAWNKDKSSVHSSWNAYFSNVDSGKGHGEAFMPPPTLFVSQSSSAPQQQQQSSSSSASQKDITDAVKLYTLVRSYQVRGHKIANLDPLGIGDADLDSSHPIELDPAHYGFTEADYDREFYLGTDTNVGFLAASRGRITLRKLLERLKQTYCGTTAIEFMHISHKTTADWFRERLETKEDVPLSHSDKLILLKRLAEADVFERFLANKFSTAKRFGLEGCESLIPGLKFMIDDAADAGVQDVVIGMPHRGRLNVLGNVVQKPMHQIFGEFQGVFVTDETDFSMAGDVKYHLGMSMDRTTRSGKNVHLSLVANPSHLECVNPVVSGKARAKQFFQNVPRKSVLPLLIHGDAAFSGQGVVYETMGLSDLYNYTTGGTIHVVANNQIGFTTDPRHSRSTPYCTDVAKGINAPIIHVNGDDPEAVVKACRLAADFRQTFGKDVVVDIIGYRRHGHNEIDQPMFTQPKMYKAIAKHPSTLVIYSKRLVSEGVLTQAEADAAERRQWDLYEEAFRNVGKVPPKKGDWLESKWKGFKPKSVMSEIKNTGVDVNALKQIGEVLCNIPSGFKAHPGIIRVFDAKREMFKDGKGFDWATAEALAFGSLLCEGNHVRLSGQDVERGTFSHRHSVLTDQDTEDKYIPLSNLPSGILSQSPPAVYTICNSNLSEFAVLGFELGYSMENPKQLVLWEGQFGDFANTAQVIFDQFLSAGESKWLRQTGLTVLLPHGMEGQGPEHSSCRLERFLQMTDDDPNKFFEPNKHALTQIQEHNWQVLNCSTPASYFHALRRQVHRDFRKPLIIATPKSLLRHKAAKSDIEEFVTGSKFRHVLDDHPSEISEDPNQIKRIVFCSGKVYYDLLQERTVRERKDIAFVRLEQIAPFPFSFVRDRLLKYKNADLVWCQEEAENMGAWGYVEPRFRTVLRNIEGSYSGKMPNYVGRSTSAAPATGFLAVHKAEQERLVNQALSL